MNIHVIDKFDTSLGLILLVDFSFELKKYDFIVDDDKNEYIIIGFHLPTNPESTDRIGLIVRQLRYGYTVANGASQEIFNESKEFLESKLGYSAVNEPLEDVDGSLKVLLSKESELLILESCCQIDYVGIKSSCDLPITCLYSWNIGK